MNEEIKKEVKREKLRKAVLAIVEQWNEGVMSDSKNKNFADFLTDQIIRTQNEAYLQGANDAIEAVRLKGEVFENGIGIGFGVAKSMVDSKAQQFIDRLEKDVKK